MSDIGITPDLGHDYITTLAKDDTPTIVRIGSEEKFVPNINASKWGDECWLNINTPDVVNAEVETFQDEKVELIIGDKTHRYYEIGGNLEYEIEFAARPISNTVTFNLTFPKGMRFLYQDTLYNDWLYDDQINAGNPGRISWEDYQLSAHRPDNIIGSYAVYWSGRDNKYRTGKFCHIYRPKLIDADGVETWAELDITDGVMTITMNRNWLNRARYPVRLDPELGYSTSGASAWGNATVKDGVINQVDATGGNVDYYYVYMESTGPTAGLKQGVYNAPSTGIDMQDETLLEQVVQDVSDSGTNQIAGGGSALSANGHYCIAHSCEHNSNDVYYDTDAGTRSPYTTGISYATQLAATGEGAWNNASTRKFSEWIDYNPAGGETIGCTVSDGIVLSDSNVNIMTLQAAIADGMVFSDSNENLKQLIAALADGAIFSDSNTILKTVLAALADGVKLSDAITVLATLQAALSDGTKLSDTPTVFKTFQGAISDGTVYSDSSTIGKLVQAALADGVTLSDAVTALVALQAALADGIKLSDTPTVLATLQGIMGDGITLTDTPTVLATLQGAIADGTIYSDSTTIGKLVQAALADGVVFSDSSIIVKTIQGLVSEGVTLSESFGAFISLLASVADGSIFSDSVTGSTSGAIAAAIAEGLVFSDSAVALGTFQAAIAEGAIFSDTESVYKLLSAAAEDGLTLSDSAAAGFILLAQLADGITLSDSGTVKATFSVTATDGVEFADLVSVIAKLGATVSDSVTLSDSSREASTLVSGIMNVTFTAGQAEITFSVSKPSIDFTGDQPSITFTGTK